MKFTRKETKYALMYDGYGAGRKMISNTLKEAFEGDWKDEYVNVFYKASNLVLPSNKDFKDLINLIWDGEKFQTLNWTMPDGHKITFNTLETVNIEVEVFGTTISMLTKAKIPVEHGTGKLLTAIIHGTDGYIVREMVNRCNYDTNKVLSSLLTINSCIAKGEFTKNESAVHKQVPSVAKLEQSEDAFADYVEYLSEAELLEYRELCLDLLKYKPFKIYAIHDDFVCHPNHVERKKHHYRSILGDLVESDLLTDILEQITGSTFEIKDKAFTKVDVMNSKYAIC